MTTTGDYYRQVSRHLTALNAQAKRVEELGFGRNEVGSVSAAERRYRLAFEALVRLEDEVGAAACGGLTDRFDRVRDRACDAGLLDRWLCEILNGEVLDAIGEPEAVAA